MGLKLDKMEYVILSRDYITELQTIVMQYIARGYVPQGGIAISDERTAFGGTNRFHQAMVRTR